LNSSKSAFLAMYQNKTTTKMLVIFNIFIKRHKNKIGKICF
jgi:hypothetical protein